MAWFRNQDVILILRSLAILHQQVDHILAKLEVEMHTLDEVLSDVAEERTKIDSVIVLVNGLRDQVKNLPGMSVENQAKVDAIFDAVESNKAAVGAALDANITTGEAQSSAQ